jgi:hypothetical protein
VVKLAVKGMRRALSANQSLLEIHSVLSQVQDFAGPHPDLVGHQVDGLQVQGRMGLQLLKFFG